MHSEIDAEILDAKHSNRLPFKIYSKITRSAQVANESKWVENIDNVLITFVMNCGRFLIIKLLIIFSYTIT